MVLTLFALTSEAKEDILHFHLKEVASNNRGADYEDEAPGREGTVALITAASPSPFWSIMLRVNL